MNELTHSEKILRAGVLKFGSEQAYRQHQADSARKADRTTPRGLSVVDPKRRKEISRAGGIASGRARRARKLIGGSAEG